MIKIGMTTPRRLQTLDAIFGGQTSIPTTWYLGLSTTAPADDGTQFTEPVGGSYARVAMANNLTTFQSAALVSGQTIKRNAIKLTFPNPTGLWGALGWYGLFLTSTGGVPQWWAELDQIITARSGNTPVEFDPEALIFKIAGG